LRQAAPVKTIDLTAGKVKIIKDYKVPYKPRRIGGRQGTYKYKGAEITALQKEVKILERTYIKQYVKRTGDKELAH